MRVYKNNKAGGLGIFFNSVITEKEFLSYSRNEKQRILGNSVVLQDIPDSLSNMEFSGNIADEYNYAENKADFKKVENDGHLLAEVYNNYDRILFISLPYDIGWNAFIDGQKVDVLRGDIGFQAIVVPKGHHNIEMKYRTPWMGIGMIVSLIGVSVFISSLLYFKHRKVFLYNDKF